jgi:hypothetical protein
MSKSSNKEASVAEASRDKNAKAVAVAANAAPGPLLARADASQRESTAPVAGSIAIASATDADPKRFSMTTVRIDTAIYEAAVAELRRQTVTRLRRSRSFSALVSELVATWVETNKRTDA